MVLKQGMGSVKHNVDALTQGAVGNSRRKAIKTLAKKHGISLEQARLRQAIAISYAQAKKKMV